MQEWCDPQFDAKVITHGKGASLTDADGRTYLDGNASIWTNLHGHRHPHIDAAIRRQLKRVAHTSFLGLTNDVAPLLAAKLVQLLRAPRKGYKVFFSDDGSTAIEAALKIAVQARLQRGEIQRKRFVNLAGAYHGDTVGAMSLSHSPQFHTPFTDITFEATATPGPGCYRCPYNQAHPARGRDQRKQRRCAFECLEAIDQLLADRPETISALVMEPRVQGSAGMWMHPHGFLRHAAATCRRHGIWLILDEIMTGFGRTGSFFACQKEHVQPDFMCLAKGLTGGYLPLAATLVAGEIFDAFLGDPSQNKTFFHGHSYTGNPLACSAALANLEVFERDGVLAAIKEKTRWLREETQVFWHHPNVGDVRQEGMLCAIELVENFDTRRPLPTTARTGFRVCRAAQAHGLLTRPVGDVLVLMPPYCSTRRQIHSMAQALWAGLCEVLTLPHGDLQRGVDLDKIGS